jgi:hypothetical protein
MVVTATQPRRPRIKTYVSLSDEDCLSYVQRAYVDEGRIGQTSRHYYYKLLGYQVVQLTTHKNSARQAYAYVCRLLVKARRKGLLPWSAVVDPGRRHITYYSWHLREYARSKTTSYISLDIWRGQGATGVEVWVEKDIMMAQVNSFVKDYRIPVQVNKGYGSAAAIKDASERYGNGKNWTLLYIGDFDPSGLDIDRALRDILRKHGCRPNIVRIALTQEDTGNLIPNAGLGLKPKDPRYKRFINLYGKDQQGYEVDSLPVHLLRQRIMDQLSLYVDLDAFEQVKKLEQAVNSLFTDKLKGTLDDLTKAILDGGVRMPGLTLTPDQQRVYLLPPDELEAEDEDEMEEEDEDEYEEEDEEDEDDDE